jgi:hypothetical protein
VEKGDLLVIRRVGAFNQSMSSAHGALEAHVAVRDAGEWSGSRAEPVERPFARGE